MKWFSIIEKLPTQRPMKLKINKHWTVNFHCLHDALVVTRSSLRFNFFILPSVHLYKDNDYFDIALVFFFWELCIERSSDY